MKDLKNFEEDSNNCSRCGLCQAVCPVFQITKNDCTSPKGKFIMLNEFFKSKNLPSEEMKKYMAQCLNCQKCLDYCPSKLNVVEVNKVFFEKFPQHKFLNKHLKLLLSILKCFIDLYRFLKLDFIVEKSFNIFIRLGSFGKRVLVFNSFIKKEVKLKKYKMNKKPICKVLYFQGCVNKYINPSSKNALLNILKANNIEVVSLDFDCCGRFYLFSGAKNEYEKCRLNNLKLINSLEYDKVVFDCATCYSTVFDYDGIDKSKLIMASDFIEELGIIKEVSLSKILYKKPCLIKEPELLKKMASNLEVIDDCCGFSAPFFIDNKKTADEISKKLASKVIESDADVILTECSLCKLGLLNGLILKGADQKIMSLCEYVEKIFTKNQKNDKIGS